MSRRAFGALIGAFTVLTLLGASVVPVAAASPSRPTVTLGTSVSGTAAAVTVNVNRGTRRIASCRYVLDGAPAVPCGSATAIGKKASRYSLTLTNLAGGSHRVSVSVALNHHRIVDKAITFAIADTDTDQDGVPNAADNCPTIANANQANTYGSAKGDACEDTDGNGTLDVDEGNICVSVDGVAILGPVGTSTCASNQSTGQSPNVAVSDGNHADAFAGTGDGDTATAIGSFAIATANDGNGNSAIATGNNAGASAGFGDNNTATATGAGAFAGAIGNNNTATATGDNAIAFADATTGCTVVNNSCP